MFRGVMLVLPCIVFLLTSIATLARAETACGTIPVRAAIVGAYPTRTGATMAGDGSYGDDDNTDPLAASFNLPTDVAVHPTTGDVYVADYIADAVRKIAAADGAVTTVAGNGVQANVAHATDATQGSIAQPQGLAIDTATDTLYISSRAHVLLRVPLSGATRPLDIVAGADGVSGSADHTNAPLSARFSQPQGLAFDADRRVLYVADNGNDAIRAYNVSSGAVTTLASGYPLKSPRKIARHALVDALFVTNAVDDEVRVVRVPLDPATGAFVAPMAKLTGLTSGGGGDGEFDDDDDDDDDDDIEYVGISVFANATTTTLVLADNDYDNSRIAGFAVSGTACTALFNMGGKGYADGASPRFKAPAGIAADPVSGAVVVADFRNRRVRLLQGVAPACTPVMTTASLTTPTAAAATTTAIATTTTTTTRAPATTNSEAPSTTTAGPHTNTTTTTTTTTITTETPDPTTIAAPDTTTIVAPGTTVTAPDTTTTTTTVTTTTTAAPVTTTSPTTTGAPATPTFAAPGTTKAPSIVAPVATTTEAATPVAPLTTAGTKAPGTTPTATDSTNTTPPALTSTAATGPAPTTPETSTQTPTTTPPPTSTKAFPTRTELPPTTTGKLAGTTATPVTITPPATAATAAAPSVRTSFTLRLSGGAWDAALAAAPDEVAVAVAADVAAAFHVPRTAVAISNLRVGSLIADAIVEHGELPTGTNATAMIASNAYTETGAVHAARGGDGVVSVLDVRGVASAPIVPSGGVDEPGIGAEKACGVGCQVLLGVVGAAIVGAVGAAVGYVAYRRTQDSDEATAAKSASDACAEDSSGSQCGESSPTPRNAIGDKTTDSSAEAAECSFVPQRFVEAQAAAVSLAALPPMQMLAPPPQTRRSRRGRRRHGAEVLRKINSDSEWSSEVESDGSGRRSDDGTGGRGRRVVINVDANQVVILHDSGALASDVGRPASPARPVTVEGGSTVSSPPPPRALWRHDASAGVDGSVSLVRPASPARSVTMEGASPPLSPPPAMSLRRPSQDTAASPVDVMLFDLHSPRRSPRHSNDSASPTRTPFPHSPSE